MKVKNILVSQPQPADLDKSPYSDLINKYKVNIDFRKFIVVEGVSASEFRKDKVYIQEHTAIIFTSRNAVDHFFRIAKDMRVEIPDSMKYFCISEATAFYLQKYVQYRKRKIFHGQQSFTDLIELIKKHKEEKYLLPCSDIHKLSLINELDASKVSYKKAVIYKTLASDLSDIEINSYDLLVFFSPAGVASLFKNFPKFEKNHTLIGAFGPTTVKAIKDSGLTVDIAAPTKTALSMTVAIEQHLQKVNKKK
ncbi:MAG: uroporphyrinogen-III synthase [Bacteroidales bacterium]|nr:uroporphyrinogen-III synthase [Bacteroidales bacterium]MCF8405294.1 uroporphyrinogen-III synthase [Bacteroidales bacterium]